MLTFAYSYEYKCLWFSSFQEEVPTASFQLSGEEGAPRPAELDQISNLGSGEFTL